jgi:hypothetical protein
MDTAARARLDRWTQSLLDKADRLLDLADHGIPIAGDPVRIVFALVGGTRIAMSRSDELTALRRAARDALADGEHVLWLAIGELTWTDRQAQAHTSPIVLWPVAFDGDKLVAASDRAPRLNDVLAMRLRAEHELVLEAAAPLDLVAALDAATELAADSPGWAVTRTARLGTFAFADFDVWRDVQALEPSAPLQWLLGETPPPALPPAGAGDDVVTPLDADAAQLAAVRAAAAGGSFVLQGPPGTGKSQTIANLVVQCASQGTSVLVVSDRVTALDAIRRRLATVGLDHFCSVPGQAPERPSRPFGAATSMSRTRVAEVAAQLDAHVDALHAIGDLGMSIHEVLGRLVELRTTPNAALAEPDAAALDRTTFERRRRAMIELADAGAAVEPVASHPWRASALSAWSADATLRATQALETAGDIATALASSLVELGKLVPHIVTRTADQIRAVGALAAVAAVSPRPGTELLSSPRSRTTGDDVGEHIALVRARGGGTLDTPRDPAAFVALASRHRALVREVEEAFFASAAAELDAAELWTQLKRWTASMAPLRFVALRDARARVRAAAIPGHLVSDEAMVTALEALIAERACRTALVAAAEPARRWFGELGGDPLALDLDKVEAALAWASELRRAFDQLTTSGGEAGRISAWRALIAQVAAGPTLPSLAALDRGDLVPFARLADAVARWEPAVTELATATGIPHALLGAGHDHVAVLRTQIDALARAASSLGDWTRFHLARRAAIDTGIRAAVVAIERADLDAAELALAWERATLLAWVERAIARSRELACFDGTRHHTLVTSFADLDRGAMAVARGRMPRLAPCVLATPQAVARCALPMFDVVVFDEASRLPIAHALPALARARAVVVVGDVRQLLPADGADGLLDVALAAGLPELVLATHYRSRHHDLFAFANQRYYFDLVEVLPAAQRTSELGLAWRKVDGAPDATGANRAEAEAIVADIAARLEAPERKSIAIVAFSRAQQALIEDLLETQLIDRTGDEPLLVGTPDRLQGEERDLVYVSIGDSAESLGALAHPGAERWLDVAITRARDQLVLVSSFAPEAVPVDAPWTARGLAELLAFARDGVQAGDAPAASPITAAIARALGERGWTVRHRVGTGAAAVELAVVDPDDPNRCVLAIEHDGTAYAGAVATRDRDRLRTQQLARLGWRVHRVWSLDWWLDAEREIARAHGAIVAAVAAGRQRRAPASGRRRLASGSAPLEIATADTTRATGPTDALLASGSGPLQASDSKPVRLPRGAIAIGPYQAAAIPPGRRVPDDMFGGRHHGELGKVVEQVLAAEAPIHVELLARRVAAYFGVGRLTPRITDRVRAALDGRGRFADEPDVVWRIDQDPASVPAVRVAGSSAVACRDIAQIPLFEVAAAARIVVERAAGLTTNELVRDCARLLGFARLDARISERVAQGVQLATARELIAVENDRAHLLTA